MRSEKNSVESSIEIYKKALKSKFRIKLHLDRLHCEKTGFSFQDRKTVNVRKFYKQRNMLLKSILTLLKINLSYLELFY